MYVTSICVCVRACVHVAVSGRRPRQRRQRRRLHELSKWKRLCAQPIGTRGSLMPHDMLWGVESVIFASDFWILIQCFFFLRQNMTINANAHTHTHMRLNRSHHFTHGTCQRHYVFAAFIVAGKVEKNNMLHSFSIASG